MSKGIEERDENGFLIRTKHGRKLSTKERLEAYMWKADMDRQNAERAKIEAHQAEQRKIEADEERAHKARLSDIRRGELKASDVKRLVHVVTKEGNEVIVELRLRSSPFRGDERQEEIDKAVIDAIEKGTTASGGYVNRDGLLGAWGGGIVTSPKGPLFTMNESGS